MANSRTSEGSKSAGTESQSEASKESSGDLSERCVDALAVWYCIHHLMFVPNLLFFQGGSTTVRRLWPGGGADQPTDRGIQDLLVQGGEPELYQGVGHPKCSMLTCMCVYKLGMFPLMCELTCRMKGLSHPLGLLHICYRAHRAFELVV